MNTYAGSPDRFYFLPKDPHWSFLWWKLSQDTLDRVNAETTTESDKAELGIRIYDVTGITSDMRASSHFDLRVHGITDHWYLQLPACNRTYCADLGFFLGSGTFLPVLRSNHICVPPDAPSPAVQQRWSTIKIS